MHFVLNILKIIAHYLFLSLKLIDIWKFQPNIPISHLCYSKASICLN